MHPADYSLALFGPRNAGKTVYLVSLYGGIRSPSDDDGVQVSSSDEKSDGTHRYLSRHAEEMSRGRWPQATVFDELKRLEFELTAGTRACRVSLPDVGGEVVRRAVERADFETAEQTLKQAILEEYEICDGYLLILPAEPPSEVQSLELKWEVDALFRAAREAELDGMLRRPLAILLSKWDRVSREMTDRVREEAAAQEFFRQHFPHLAASIASQCRRWRVFPVSATGHFTTSQPPFRLRPFNVGAPLRWLLDGADEAYFEVQESQLSEVESFLTLHAERLFEPDASDPTGGGRPIHRIARERILQILTRVPEGPLAVRARQLQDGLAQRVRKRQQVYLGLGAAILAAVLLLGVAYREWSADDDVYRQSSAALGLTPMPGTEEAVIERVGRVLDEPGHGLGRITGRWSNLRRQYTEYVRRFEERHFDAILPLRDLSDFSQSEQAWEKATHFLRRFPQSSHRAEVEQIAESARQKVLAGEEPAWEALRQLEADNPTNYGPIVARYRQYLHQPLFRRHRAEAERRAAECELAWDRTLYAPIQNEAASQNTGENVERLHDLCRRYLAGPCPRKGMEESVRRWLEWFARMQSGLLLRFQVESVLIQSGSRWNSLLYTPHISVAVSNGQEWQSTDRRTVSIGFEMSFANAPLGPLNWRWGQPVSVRVTCWN